jgi:hypothetical protein
MAKAFVFVLLCFLCAACNKPNPLPPLPPDTSTPTLSNPIVSFASVTRFIPFGGIRTNAAVCEGYEILLTDTEQFYVSASQGIVSSISLNSSGSNDITVKYKANSIYSFLYSGVRNVQVQVNDSLIPGTILGKVSYNGDIYMSLTRSNEALCPHTYASTGFNTAIQLAIGKDISFNPADSALTACLKDSLSK